MSISTIGHSVHLLRQKFSHSIGLPIRDALPAATIEAVLYSEGFTYRRCLLDPVVTIWAFLSQVLDTDRCCRKAMSRVWAYLSESTPVPLLEAPRRPIPAGIAKRVSVYPNPHSIDSIPRWPIPFKPR